MKRTTLLSSDPNELPSGWLSSDLCEIFVIRKWAKDRSEEVKLLSEFLPDLPGHVWLASSGTLSVEGKSKWLAVSKAALLASAEAVNKHLNIQAADIWGLTLPLAHVGGLGIIVRASLLDQSVKVLIHDRWDPDLLSSAHWQGHWLSLVPTQVHDLVANKVTPPATLKGVVVGGDRLSEQLYHEAKALGWPLLPSYGLTECCSQVATTLPGQIGFEILPHIEAKTDNDDRLWIKSQALYTGEAILENGHLSYFPRESEWWGTQDRARISQNKLSILGRLDGTVKVRGEKVELMQLESELELKLQTRLVIVPLPDARDGMALWAVSENQLDLIQANTGLLSHQKLKGVKVISQFPRTALGKIKRAEVCLWLQDQLSSSNA